MAKPPLVIPFTFAESLVAVGDLEWAQLRTGGFDGGAGNFTISRVKFYYQLATQPGITSNGALDTCVLMAIAVTTGNPAPLPTRPPVNEQSASVDEIIYREIPRLLMWDAGQEAVFGPAEGVLDAKSQTSIPAAPGEAVVWVGLQRFDEAGPVSGNLIELRGWGFVVRLGV